MTENKKILKDILKTISEDGKIISTEPKFEKNPIGHVVWFILKKKQKNAALRKIFVLNECYKGPKSVSYSYRGLDLHKSIGRYNQENIMLILNTMVNKFCQ